MITIDQNIMRAIILVIIQNKPKNMRHLYNMVTGERYLNRSISGSTLYQHLVTLRRLGYLKPHALEISSSVIIEKFQTDRLEFPAFHAKNNEYTTLSAPKKRRDRKKEIVRKIIENRSPARKNEKILVMILAQAVFGSGRNLPSKTVQRGDVIIQGKAYYYDELKGTGISDFMTDFKNINLNSIFNNICFTRSEVDHMLKILHNFIPMSRVQTRLSNMVVEEERWIISDESLAQVIREIILIFSDVCLMVRYWWTYVEPPGRRGQERQWYEILYGEATTDKKFSKIFDKSQNLHVNKEPDYSLIKQTIRSCKASIDFRYHKLLTEYNRISDKYRSFLDFFLHEVCYPKFLRDKQMKEKIANF